MRAEPVVLEQNPCGWCQGLIPVVKLKDMVSLHTIATAESIDLQQLDVLGAVQRGGLVGVRVTQVQKGRHLTTRPQSIRICFD